MFSYCYCIKDCSLQSYIQEITELKNMVPIAWSMFTGKWFTEISTHPTDETFSIKPDKNRCQDSIFRPGGGIFRTKKILLWLHNYELLITSTIYQPIISVAAEQSHPQTIGKFKEVQTVPVFSYVIWGRMLDEFLFFTLLDEMSHIYIAINVPVVGGGSKKSIRIWEILKIASLVTKLISIEVLQPQQNKIPCDKPILNINSLQKNGFVEKWTYVKMKDKILPDIIQCISNSLFKLKISSFIKYQKGIVI